MEGTIKVDPRTEIIGQAILPGLAGLGDAVLPFLQKYGLGNLNPEQWYPLHAWLSVIYDISSGDNPMFDQVAIGMKVVDNALFPPEINSIPSVMHSINTAYYMNHRNGEIGFYRAEDIGERQIKMVAETPYPDFMNYGILYGAARKFQPPDAHLIVRHDDTAPCTRTGGSSCTYYISW